MFTTNAPDTRDAPTLARVTNFWHHKLDGRYNAPTHTNSNQLSPRHADKLPSVSANHLISI